MPIPEKLNRADKTLVEAQNISPNVEAVPLQEVRAKPEAHLRLEHRGKQ